MTYEHYWRSLGELGQPAEPEEQRSEAVRSPMGCVRRSPESELPKRALVEQRRGELLIGKTWPRWTI